MERVLVALGTIVVIALGSFVALMVYIVWTDPNEDAWVVFLFYGALLVPAVLLLRLAYLSGSTHQAN